MLDAFRKLKVFLSLYGTYVEYINFEYAKSPRKKFVQVCSDLLYEMRFILEKCEKRAR